MTARLGLFELRKRYTVSEIREKLSEIQEESRDNIRAWHSPGREGALTFGASGDVLRWLDGRHDSIRQIVPDSPDFQILAVGIDFDSNQTLMFEIKSGGYEFIGSFNEKGNLEGNPFVEK